MKSKRQQPSQQRQGKSFVLLLTIVCVIVLGAVAGYFYLQRKAMEEARERQLERVADAQAKLDRDIAELLKSADVVVNNSDANALKQIIRKIAILDVNSTHAEALMHLKREFRKLELREDQIETLTTKFNEEIQNENFSAGAVVVEKLQRLSVITAAQEAQLAQLQKRIEQRKSVQSRCKKELQSWELEAAEKSLSELKKLKLNDAELAHLKEGIDASKAVALDAEKAVQRIRDQDTGKYSAELTQEVSDLLNQYQKYPALLQLQKKFDSYPQTVRVPGDVASLDEALELARAGDIVELGEGTFYVESVISQAVRIVGAGKDKTILDSHTVNGPALSFIHKIGKSELSGVSLKGDRESSQRHSLILVDGAELEMRDCLVKYAPGHGLAVVSGEVLAASCVFSDNCWDGVSVNGAASKVTLGHCQSLFNAEHGIDFWGGAQGVLLASHVSSNSKSGIVVTGAGSSVTASRVQSDANREAGFYVGKQAKLACSAVEAKGNILSGFVLADAGSTLELENTIAEGNREFGYFVDPAATFLHEFPLKGEGNLLGLKGQK